VIFAAHHRLSNLIAVVDYNKIQSLASIDETLGLEPFADKWRAFGWDVIEIDGHDHQQLSKSLGDVGGSPNRPRCVIAHTIKGKGVSFMERSVLWHYRSPQKEELAAALAELK
jgi:transketolase